MPKIDTRTPQLIPLDIVLRLNVDIEDRSFFPIALVQKREGDALKAGLPSAEFEGVGIRQSAWLLEAHHMDVLRLKRQHVSEAS